MTKELADDCGDSTASFGTVAKWVAEFKDSVRAFKDALRSARRLTAVTDRCIRAVEEVVMHDRQIFVRRIADQLSISKTSIYKIMSDNLRMKEVYIRWIPKSFTPLQRVNRADC